MSLAAAAEIGLTPAEWAAMTPRELNICLRAHGRARERRAREDRVRIYNLASLVRTFIWSKHPPSLDRAFREAPRPGRAMTDQEMLARVRAIHAALGGDEP